MFMKKLIVKKITMVNITYFNVIKYT